MSALGEAFFIAFTPLQIYLSTKSPIWSSLDLLLSSLGLFLSGVLVARFSFIKKDGRGVALMEGIPLAGTVILLLVIDHSSVLYFLLFDTFIFSLAFGIKSGFIEGYIGHASNGNQESRVRFSAAIRSSTQLGAIIGLSIAAPVATLFPLRIALLLCAVCFLVSCSIFLLAPSGQVDDQLFKPRAGGYALLWIPQIRALTCSHLIAAMAMSLLFGCAFFALNDNFHASPAQISSYFVAEMGGALAGSILAQRLSGAIIKRNCAIIACRLSYAIPMCLVTTATGAAEFVVAIGILTLVHSVAVPIWLALFQEFAHPSERRLIGASRKSAVAFVGMFGYSCAGFLYRPIGLLGISIISVGLIFASVYFLKLHLQSRCIDTAPQVGE